MNLSLRKGVLAMLATCLNAFSVTYEFKGEPNAQSGWTVKVAEAGKMVYIPFEGVYENKGGRIQSPKFRLDKPENQGAFYRLTFTAKAEVQGYWWVDFYDKNDALLPDINSALYASKEFIKQEGVLYVNPLAVSAVIAFVTKKGVSVRDIKMERISPLAAAEWCDKLYSTLPQKPFQVSQDAFALLPKTRAALNNGTPWRILLLGDSIVNDTWCSNFQALVMRDFPQAKIDFRISVRGSTGVWFYHTPEHFQEYVGQYQPNLVIIGGISNVGDPKTYGEPEANLTSVIEQSRALGAEVVVVSPGLSYKWRPGAAPVPFDENLTRPNGAKPYRRDYQYAATQKTKTAYWDLTTVPCSIVADCPQESSWFSRDEVHSNDRGMQLQGQNLAAWFRMAKDPASK